MKLWGQGKVVLIIFISFRYLVCYSPSGVYILQNTMARGGEWCWVKKNENEAVRNKMKKKEKGERKKRKGKGGE